MNEVADLIVCRKCSIAKSIDQFYIKYNREKEPYPSECKQCIREYYDNPENELRFRNRILMKKYGITHDQYIEMSKNGCMLCGKLEHLAGNKRLCVDHDHKTGKVRGILCSPCNRNIGVYFDDKDMFNKVMEYLDA